MTFAAIAASVMLSGCAANPLVGHWTAMTPSSTYTLATTLVLADDNTMTVTDTGTRDCTGMRTITGLRWSSSHTESAMTVTFSGAPVCSGMIVCTTMGTTTNIDCPMDTSQMTGACGYALSSDMNTLTLSNCSGTSGPATVYTRAAN
jgi:hypothetical protein